MYPSPMADFGYDISDFRDVDPMFGTLKDFDELLAKAKELGVSFIKLLNRSIRQHKWEKLPAMSLYLTCSQIDQSNTYTVLGGLKAGII
jgi:hypothetical protein